jgi:CRP-like cAMP-binding protein
MPSDHPELLKNLSPADAAQVIALGSRMSVASGSVLFQLGADADRIFLIERGRINLTLPMQVLSRDEDVLVEERVSGQTLGWSALIPPHRFTLKATAQIDTQVLAVPRAALLDHFAARPEVGYLVTRNVAEVIGQRLQVFQAMWLREMQRVVELSQA